MKKDVERYALERFKELYNDFPKGVLIQGERPDSVIKCDDKVIGIEVAETFADLKDDKGSLLMKLQSDRDYVGNELVKLLVRHTDNKFSLGIEFNKGHHLTQQNKRSVIDDCFSESFLFIANTYKGFTRIRNVYGSGLLPKEINSISINVYPKMQHSFYNQAEGGCPPNLQYSHIEPLLTKHENELPKYKQCDEHWLLIHHTSRISGMFNEFRIETPIQSMFDKVFLMRSIPSECVQLK